MMPIFKLLGHKGICTHKTYPTIAQFLEEYEPRGVSVRNIRQLEGQLNLLGVSVLYGAPRPRSPLSGLRPEGLLRFLTIRQP
jgi:hypothetical protein